MTRIIAIIIAVTLLIYPVASVDAESKPPAILDSIAGLAWTTFDPYNEGAAGEVRNHCSTTAINQKMAYWLTAAHCVTYWGADPEAPWESVVEGYDYQINGHAATVVYLDVRKDLAILQTVGYSPKAIPIAKKGPRYLDEVTVAGYPLGWDVPAITRGYVATPVIVFPGRAPYTIFQVPGAPGSSGSSVLNKKGQIVSVVQIGWGNTFSPVMGGATFESLIEFLAPYRP